jgi:hypothetical protein
LRLWLTAGAVAFVLGCGDASPVGVPSSDPAAPAGSLFGFWPNVGLLQCTPLAPDSVTQTVGPEGGVIQVGVHSLVIPSGALSDPVEITAVAPSDTVNRVQFEPQGLSFARPATLTMSYANCKGVGSWLPKRIAYTTDDLVILQLLWALDDLFHNTVTAHIGHFSDYAIAW